VSEVNPAIGTTNQSVRKIDDRRSATVVCEVNRINPDLSMSKHPWAHQLPISDDELRLGPDGNSAGREVVLWRCIFVENRALVVANPHVRPINLNVY